MYQRTILLVLVLFSCALLAYSCARAYRLSFVHDESISYTILGGDLRWKDTANHHPLNTLLMGWSYHWLGPLEWQLRLPNVLSHIVYLGFGLLLLRQLKEPASMLLGFALLNFNPFLLDFFGLARGYGLALGFSMAALFLLREAWLKTEVHGRSFCLLLSLASAALADLANFTWLNLHVPLLVAALFVLFVQDDLKFRRDWAVLLWAVVLFTANVAHIRNIANRVWNLNQRAELYARGKIGFVTDTMSSLVDSYFYTRIYPNGLKWTLIAVAIAAFILATITLGFRIWRSHRIPFSAVLLLLLALAVAAPIAEHFLFGVEYPVERIALYYVPITGVLAIFFVDEMICSKARSLRLLGVAACLLVVGLMFAHLSKTANLHHTYTWFYDADTKAAMSEIARHVSSTKHNGRISIGNTWFFEPAMNYYRTSRKYDWLNPVVRDRLPLTDNDMIYCYPTDIDISPYAVVRRYPITGALLLQAKHE